MLTRWVVFHVASGQSFLTGAACLVVAAGLSAVSGGRRVRIVRNALASIGGILVFASAAPLPPWSYVFLLVASLGWSAAEALGGRISAWLVMGGRIVVASAWAAAVLVELPHHFMPSVPRQPGRPVLGVIGDSITAGVGDAKTVTWPHILASRYGVTVRDHSRAGADVASALRQAASVSPDERLVLLEIGGNDVLGGTTPAAFEAGLARLLAAVRRPDRVIVMLELPLPPTYNAYGRAQRRLARRYGASLIPRRVLLGVLLRPGATLDSIHLSPEGHGAMADAVWGVLRSGYPDEPRRWHDPPRQGTLRPSLSSRRSTR